MGRLYLNTVRLVCCLAPFAVGMSAALAQSISTDDGGNQVVTGQIGAENTALINQSGNDNRAGAVDPGATSADPNYAINQIGRNNEIDIDQTGLNNTIGVVDGLRITGVTQNGNANALDIDQDNDAAGAGNRVGAVLQESLDRDYVAPPNTITVLQTGSTPGSSLGAAEHYIGVLIQENSVDLLGNTNTIAIEQVDGGVGLGNILSEARQTGSGNVIDSQQQVTENSIGAIIQRGTGNETEIDQTVGSSNQIDDIEQYGVGNQMILTQTGTNNVIVSAYQNNESVGQDGNVMVVTLTGDDNGGDGSGGDGAFRIGGIAASANVLQGVLTQLGGDDNDIRLTITGNRNLFGVIQDGDGNKLVAVIGSNPSGSSPDEGNELAVFQQGDGNDLVVNSNGSNNGVAVTMIGENNYANVQQTGDRNRAVFTVDVGNNNNLLNTSPGWRAVAEAASNAFAGGLQAGDTIQIGNDNLAEIIINGNGNQTAIGQDGSFNNAAMTILSGSGNQAVISQTGMMNVAWSRQSGTGNTAAIIQ